MNILAVSGIAVIAAVLCALLRRYHAEYAAMAAIAAGLLITVQLLSAIEPAVLQISSLLTAVEESHLSIVFKALGVCFLTQFAADACTDAGERTMASRVEFAGRITVVVLALPLFEKIAEAVLLLTGADT